LPFHHYAVLNANAVICLILDNNCESVLNLYFYCVSAEKIQIQVYCISRILIRDTVLKMYLDTRYKIHFSYFRDYPALVFLRRIIM